MAMKKEHCSSTTEFTTSNYNVTTTPEKEWDIVVNCNESRADMGHGRKLMKPEEILSDLKTQGLKISIEEVVSVVLYTGPMVSRPIFLDFNQSDLTVFLQFQIYNTILRRFPKQNYEELKGDGNIFTTTLYALVSGIITIARETKIPAGTKLYRGLGGDRTFPPFFFKSDTCGRKGMLEWGFTSTTMDKQMAIQYSGIKEGKPFPTIFEIEVGAVDRGADISSFSQYPGKCRRNSVHSRATADTDAGLRGAQARKSASSRLARSCSRWVLRLWR